MFGDFICFIWDFPCGSADKESTCNAGDLGSVSGLGRPTGEENGYPLQNSGLENSTDCIVHWVAKSQTLRDSLFLVAQLVKNPPAVQETPVQFLSWVDLLEKG